MPPEQLGPYKIGRRLGRGGMGTVFAGTHMETGEQAAVKILAPALAADENFRLRFSGEIETLKRLRHPHIVQLFGFGEQGGTVFYAMELVAGTNLEEELARGRRFDWREAVRIGIDICRALKHAHDHGVIHRDLKPANLLWGPDEQIKLTDFGIAKFFGASSLTAEGVIGTADYMAPEQAEGKPVTVRSDLYSLGCVLYAVLVGEPPFRGRTLAEVIYKLQHDEPASIVRRNPDVPRAFDAIIRQLLAKDPDRRFRSATAVAKALQAMEHALSVHPEVLAPPPDIEADFILNEPAAKPPATRELDPLVHQRATAEQGTVVPQPAAPAPPGSAGSPFSGPTRLVEQPHGTLSDAPPSEEAILATPTRVDHFTPVDVRRRAGGDEDESGAGWTPAIIAGAILAIVALWFTWLLWPLSADRLYERIAAAANDGNDQLAAVETEMTQFVSRFPSDVRVTEVQGYLQEVELARQGKRLAQSVRRARSGKLGPVARAYGEAIRLRETDPDQAAARLAALLEAFVDPVDPLVGDEGKTLELARRQLAKLREEIASRDAADRGAFEERLARAEALLPKEPDAAAAILQGSLALWGHEPWAADLAARGRELLRRAEAPKAARTP